MTFLAVMACVSCALAACSGGTYVGAVPSATATPAGERISPLGVPSVIASLLPTAPARPSTSPSPVEIPSVVSIVTPTPTPTPVFVASNVEVPIAADQLANSIGINPHTPTLYTESDFSTIVSLVKSLGVRHLRDGIVPASTSYDAAVNQMLNATGATVDGITNCPNFVASYDVTTPAAIQQFQSAIGNRLESVEGPNEVDNTSDQNWVADTQSCLPGISNALPGVPFIAPSLVNVIGDAPLLGNLSSEVNYGNIHRYFSGHIPGSTGWGGTFACGVYGALTFAICEAQVNSGSKPVMVTETGYNSQNEVDETTQAKYLSRLFLDNLGAGITRSFVYDLKDDPTDSTFGGDGIVRSDDSEKPSFLAIQSEIAYFSDKGSQPLQLPFKYSLANTSLSHLLFRKRDGTYILALWNETASWNTATSTPIVVAPQQQTITFPLPPLSFSARSLDDAGVFVSNPAVLTGNVATLLVDDHVTVVSFKSL